MEKILGQTFIPLHLSEPDKHNKNRVKHAIYNLKAGCSKFRNACGAGVLYYHYEMMEYFYNINNYVSQARLNNRLPYEEFWG